MHTCRLLILTALFLALAAPARAADAGVWTPAPNMNVARSGAAAVALNSGKVLVVGGTNDRARGAEVYDPATGTWTLTGAMNGNRGAPNVVKLADGRVLAANGTTAEIYNPATNTWAQSNLAALHDGGTLAALDGGGALITGGVIVYDDENNLFQNATSLFNGTWTGTGNLPGRRYSMSAATLPGNRALVSGGMDTDGHFAYMRAYTSLYQGGGWSDIGAMNTVRVAHLLTPLLDGRVLATGGVDNVNRTASTEIFTSNPNGGSWAWGAAMGIARADHTATRLANGKVLVAGGLDGASKTIAYTELYDPGANSWTAAGNLRTARSGAGATTLPDGRVLIAGGRVGTAASATTELWAPATFVGTESAVVFNDAAPGATVASVLTVTNTGSAPLFASAFALGGETPGAFAIDAARCRAAIAPGTSCTVDVRYTPPAVGTHRATVTFTANTAAGTHSIPLTGRGLEVQVPGGVIEVPGGNVAVADGDGDGVLDATDRCGGLAGPAVRLGCPSGLLGDPSIRYRTGKRGIRVIAYYVKATTGARVTVSCSRGCKPTTTTGRGAKRVRISRLSNRRLTNGTRITITVSMPGRLTTRVTDTIKRGRRIEGRPRCAPVAC